MQLALEAAEVVRGSTAPNPWVGCAIVGAEGDAFVGATEPPPGAHAEIVALRAARGAACGAVLYTTLEPCNHHGRTGPCTQAIIEAGVRRVVVALVDPDPLVAGSGLAELRSAGINVEVGVASQQAAEQLEPYLHHRRTGRPFVTLKMAQSLDGRTAAPDGTSQWITGHEARVDVHRMRARADAILVGAGTIRDDNPALDVRHVVGSDPLRIVLGSAPVDAKVHPCIEVSGDLHDVLSDLGRRGVVDLLVEGGATVATAFHERGLVDHYVLYLAPALFGGDDARPLFTGAGAATMSQLWRGSVVAVRQIGNDIRVDLRPVVLH
jgi:diaminohydroxyphosphoribosylaminopyrimidine deaminase/5-amino-6-(5-phosphoribosylamino)uracil reductase